MKDSREYIVTKKFIHIFYGSANGEEGYGQQVVCCVCSKKNVETEKENKKGKVLSFVTSYSTTFVVCVDNCRIREMYFVIFCFPLLFFSNIFLWLTFA